MLIVIREFICLGEVFLATALSRKHLLKWHDVNDEHHLQVLKNEDIPVELLFIPSKLFPDIKV
jgi:hypothetical protein